MSEMKPCPALEWLCSDMIGLEDMCAQCPNRAPSQVEAELRECLLLSDCALTGAYNGLITLGLSGALPFMVEAREIMSNTRALLAKLDASEKKEAGK